MKPSSEEKIKPADYPRHIEDGHRNLCNCFECRTLMLREKYAKHTWRSETIAIPAPDPLYGLKPGQMLQIRILRGGGAFEFEAPFLRWDDPPHNSIAVIMDGGRESTVRRDDIYAFKIG